MGCHPRMHTDNRVRGTGAGGRMIRWGLGAAACLLVVLTAGCGNPEERREIAWMPDMYYSPAVKAQEETPFFPDKNGSRHPVPGTIPVNWEPNHIPWSKPEESDKMQNPLPRTKEVVDAGRRYYNTICITCHNWNGNGVTPVTQPGRMALPPVLYSDKVMNEWPDGRIFHTITHGQGNMPGYAEKLSPEKRWAIVHYVRVLQIAARPSPEQLEAFKASGITFDHDDPRAPQTVAKSH